MLLQIFLYIFVLGIILYYIYPFKKEYFTQKKFAVMWANTYNIGDDFQTLAAINLLKKNNIHDYSFINRENLINYNGPEVILIANGWYMHDLSKFPPSNKITPIFISMYVNDENLIKNNVTYFKKYEPIGCRDLSTCKLFNKYDIKNYFSGCLTITFDEYKNKNNKIYIIDPEGSNSGKNFSNLDLKNKFKNAEYIYHNYEPLIKNKNNIKKRLKLANNLLDKYKKAKLIITSRLHAALPCRAFNTDVKFLHSNYYGDKRFKGLRNIINGSNNPDIDKIPNKIDRKIINNLKRKIKKDFNNKINKYI
jgi:hypothetical protein